MEHNIFIKKKKVIMYNTFNIHENATLPLLIIYIKSLVYACVCAFDDVLGTFSMAKPATEIIDHRLPATMTLTRACVRPGPETQCLSV